jgi:hypothetical protein
MIGSALQVLLDSQQGAHRLRPRLVANGGNQAREDHFLA